MLVDMLLSSSDLLHLSIAGNKQERLVIEIKLRVRLHEHTFMCICVNISDLLSAYTFVHYVL